MAKVGFEPRQSAFRISALDHGAVLHIGSLYGCTLHDIGSHNIAYPYQNYCGTK